MTRAPFLKRGSDRIQLSGSGAGPAAGAGTLSHFAAIILNIAYCLQRRFAVLLLRMDANAIGRIVVEALSRAPAWVRNDLAAKEPALRERAEETLAALITVAITAKLGND